MKGIKLKRALDGLQERIDTLVEKINKRRQVSLEIEKNDNRVKNKK